MIYKIKITQQAENDLRGIYEYIAFELCSPVNALGQLERLETNIMKLNQMPSRFKAYNKGSWYSRGLRIMPVDNFTVFYIPDDENAVVTVIRVVYSGRDMEKELKNSPSRLK